MQTVLNLRDGVSSFDFDRTYSVAAVLSDEIVWMWTKRFVLCHAWYDDNRSWTGKVNNLITLTTLNLKHQSVIMLRLRADCKNATQWLSLL